MWGLICSRKHPPDILDCVILEGKHSVNALLPASDVVLFQSLPSFSSFHFGGPRERANALRIIAKLMRMLASPSSGGRTFAPMTVLALTSHSVFSVPIVSSCSAR